MLAGDNKFLCAQCNEKRDTLKRTCIARLPNVLFLHLKRFEFDMMEMRKVSAAGREGFRRGLSCGVGENMRLTWSVFHALGFASIPRGGDGFTARAGGESRVFFFLCVFRDVNTYVRPIASRANIGFTNI